MTLIESYEDHEIRAWRDLARTAGLTMLTNDASASRDGDLLLMACLQCAAFPFNRVLGIRCDRPATAEAITRAMAWYAACGVGSYEVQLSTGAAPPGVEKWLRGHRFTHTHESALLACRRAGSITFPRSSLEIRRIGEESAGVFGLVAAETFGWPAAEAVAASVVGRSEWHHYLAYDGSTAVGCGATYYADGLAWIGFGGVIATHRRLGCHALLLAHRIADAFRSCHTVIVDTTEGSSSYRNCLRVGFQHVASRSVYRFTKRQGLLRWFRSGR